jgi:hypothetical protein
MKMNEKERDKKKKENNSIILFGAEKGEKNESEST